MNITQEFEFTLHDSETGEQVQEWTGYDGIPVPGLNEYITFAGDDNLYTVVGIHHTYTPGEGNNLAVVTRVRLQSMGVG